MLNLRIFSRGPRRPYRSLVLTFIWLLAPSWIGNGCIDGDDHPPSDASVERDQWAPPPDAAYLDGTVEPAVDFSVSGCPQWVETDASWVCRATTPLDLGFHPLSSRKIDSYRWDFGDGSDSDDQAPIHRYEGVGSFSVSLLVSGPFGVLEASKPQLVEIRLSDLGESCSANDTCRWGLCLCSNEEDLDTCPEDIVGFCTASCKFNSCDVGLCVDLRAGLKDLSSPEVWREPYCLPGCLFDEDCHRPGTQCKLVPVYDRNAADSVPSWSRACVPPVLSELGSECRAQDGTPRDDLCLSGLCWDVGVFGQCSAPCEPGTCPPGSSCVSVGGSDQGQCLVQCGQGVTCTWDPLLECRGPGGTGAFSLTILDQDGETSKEFCAPKTCTQDQDCAPAGRCDQDGGGYCIPTF